MTESTDPTDLATQLVDAINDLHGSHAGARAAHAKGILTRGQFVPTLAAGDVSAATHFAEPVGAHIRFSNGSGYPAAHDGQRDNRGMSVKFYLPDDTTTDIVATSLPAFPVRTPEDFLELLRLRRPDPGTGAVDMVKLGEWLAAHPEAQTATMASLTAPPPASYAQLAYHALHAYLFVDAHGNRQYGRYRWQPEEGEASLANDDEAAAKSHDYLQEELRERLAAGPVGFTLEVQLADEGDPTDDPTVVWDDDRRTIDVGRLEIQAEAFDRDTGDDILVFDPTRVTPGIELSDDPILRSRPSAYSVSVERRVKTR
jgi:catalase